MTLDPIQRECLPFTWSNKSLFYATLISGNSTKGWGLSVDLFPTEKKSISCVRGLRFHVLSDEQEEPAFNPIQAVSNKLEKATKKGNGAASWTKAAKDFSVLDKSAIVDSKVFILPYDKNGDSIVWAIKESSDDVHLNHFEPEAPVIDININDYFSDNFFKHVFPSIHGHAKIVDTYLKDTRSTYFNTYRNRKFQFHDEKHDDPDHIIKQCYLLLIA